jgi:hypothetical protein
MCDVQCNLLEKIGDKTGLRATMLDQISQDNSSNPGCQLLDTGLKIS